jgi:hypothetical protein
MDRLGVDFIIVHPDLYEDEGEDGDAIVDAVESEESLRRVAGNEEAVLYRVE